MKFKNVWFRFSTCTKYKQQRFSVLAFVQLIYFLLQSLYICKFFHPSKRRSWWSKGAYCAQFEETWILPFVTLNFWRVTEKNVILKKLPCILWLYHDQYRVFTLKSSLTLKIVLIIISQHFLLTIFTCQFEFVTHQKLRQSFLPVPLYYCGSKFPTSSTTIVKFHLAQAETSCFDSSGFDTNFITISLNSNNLVP